MVGVCVNRIGKAQINAGQQSTDTVNIVSDVALGHGVSEKHRIPVTVNAHLNGSDFLFAYSTEFTIKLGNGATIADRKLSSRHFIIRDDGSCKVGSGMITELQTTNNRIEHDYTCGTTVVNDYCKILNEHP